MPVIQRNRTKTPLEHDIGSVVYLHVRKMLEAMCRRAESLGYDPIECESAANLAVVEAIRSYKPDLGEPVEWIKRHIRYALMDLKRTKSTRFMPLSADPEQFDPQDMSFEDEEPTPFDLTTVLLGLSDDAVTWVTLVIDPPEDVLATAARLGWSRTNPGGREAAKFRQAVFQFLKQSGWSNRRAVAALMEASAKLGGGK